MASQAAKDRTPTSATGTSNNPTPLRAMRFGAARGFTLLELLVVIVIIGIITSMAAISVNVLGGDHEMQREAERLQAILTQVREDAMLQGRDIGLRVDTRGYDFLEYDSRVELWRTVEGDPLLRERTLPDGLNLALRLEDRDVKLKPRSAATEREPIQPQIVVQASGDLAPFEVFLTRDGTDEMRRIAGTVLGAIEMHDDTRERR
jgi:general secretion pathway protein H